MDVLRVFISYRRDSDFLRTSLVTTQLEHVFDDQRSPRVQVFRDIRMRLGKEWPSELAAELTAADVVLAIIGPDWLQAKDQFGRRRIDQPDDWVRKEIELALQDGKVVIPIAFGGPMPPAEAFPPALAALADRQAAVVRDESHERDLEPLLNEIEQLRQGRLPSMAHQGGGRLPYPYPPMEFPPAPIPEGELALVVPEALPGWDIVEGPVAHQPDVIGVELHRDLRFATFKDAIAFMAEVADFADKANHHPRWENIFKTLSIYLTTW